MVKAARRAARKALEAEYTGTCTIIEHEKVRDEKTRQTTYVDRIVLQDQPCKLSFSRASAAERGETAVEAAQAVKLFMSPDIVVRAGSKIIVTQDNVTRDYAGSGIPAVYPTHQEIALELFERWI